MTHWVGKGCRILAAQGTVLLALLLSFSSPLAAQHYSFKNFTQETGLTNVSATCLFQDRTGLLWVGTEDGLFWYDGASFHKLDASRLSNPYLYVYAIYQAVD